MEKLNGKMKSYSLIIVTALFIFCCTKEPVQPTELRIGYIEKDEGSVQFTNEFIGFDNFSWEFGDGTTSNEVKPFKKYKTNGQFKVKLVASSRSESQTKTLDVIIRNITLDTLKITSLVYQLRINGYRLQPLIGDYSTNVTGNIYYIAEIPRECSSCVQFSTFRGENIYSNFKLEGFTKSNIEEIEYVNIFQNRNFQSTKIKFKDKFRIICVRENNVGYPVRINSSGDTRAFRVIEFVGQQINFEGIAMQKHMYENSDFIAELVKNTPKNEAELKNVPEKVYTIYPEGTLLDLL